MKHAFIFLAFGLANPRAAHATVTPGCKNPVTFGAIANDRIDDRLAFQTAIDSAIGAHVDVCIPAGTFDLTRHPNVQKLYSVTISGPVRITGEGRDVTELKMLGSGIVGSGPRPANWRFFEVRQATRVYVADLALDGSERVDTAEQTHLLFLNAPVDDVTVERLKLTLPVLAIPPGLYNCSSHYQFTGTYCFNGTTTIAGYFSGGDCARFLGSATSLVQNVVLRDVSADDCDRGAFSIQLGVDNLLIEDSLGVCRDDQALDFEPSSGAPITNVTIRRTRLTRGLQVDGTAHTAAIGGTGANPAENVLIEDSQIIGGGLKIINARNVTLNRVTLHSGTVSALPTLLIQKAAENIQILDSTIKRPPGAPANELIEVVYDGVAAHDLTISGSELEQHTPRNVAYLNSLRSFTMTDSTVVVTAPFSQGIVADANQGPMEEVRLSGVDFTFAATPTMLKIIGRGGNRVATAFVSNTTATGLSLYGVEYKLGGSDPPSPPIPNPIITGNSLSSPTKICFGYTGGGCNP